MPGWCSCTTRGSAPPIRRRRSQNAFGDRYIYSLCPSAPEVREYAVALCKDVTDNYPVIGRLARDAGLPSLRARLSPRIRADAAEPLARQPARPVFLRALRRRREGGGRRCDGR